MAATHKNCKNTKNFINNADSSTSHWLCGKFHGFTSLKVRLQDSFVSRDKNQLALHSACLCTNCANTFIRPKDPAKRNWEQRGMREDQYDTEIRIN